MKISRVFVLLVLIIVSSVSIASAQLQITTLHRGIISRLYLEDTDFIIDFEWGSSLDLGEYSESVEMPVGDGVLGSSQNTLVTNDNYTQAFSSGHMEVSITQPAMDYPNGMDSSSHVQIVYYSPFTSDYSLSGVASGPGQVILEIIEWETSEIVSSESWTGVNFSVSAQLPPGTYFFHFELLDYVYGNEPVERNSECDFDLIITPEMSIATDDMSFAAVKALYR